jgi:penicillin-binding protein 1A
MDKFDQTAHAMGITTNLDGNPAEVIGGLSQGVTPLEMADAYGTIADNGVHIPETAIAKVVFPDGSVANLGNQPHTQVFSDGEAYEATSVLKQVLTNPGGTAAGEGWGCPAAGKTGTAENEGNAWFVGYTPRLSTAVWVGYPDNNNAYVGFGGSVAAPIWHDFMEQASDGYCGDWTPPTVPWQGVPFVGPHSDVGPPPKNGGGQNGTTPTTSNNPDLFSAPPQKQPKAPGTNSKTNGNTGPPPGFGTGHNPGGGDSGGGGGSGGKKH